jgi:DNA-binding IclR family transcriptional regulator
VPESDTAVVFRILGVLGEAREPKQAPVLEEIADTLHLSKLQVEHYMKVLQQVGVVREEAGSRHSSAYSLTSYGLQRLPTTAPPSHRHSD